MYKFENNRFEVGGNSYEFDYDIRTVIPYNGNYIILLGIPFDRDEINNVYCLDAQATLVWQAEDLRSSFPELKIAIAYENIGLSDDTVFCSDFYGRLFKINPINGKLSKTFDVVK